MYVLNSIIVHEGSATVGRYFACILVPYIQGMYEHPTHKMCEAVMKVLGAHQGPMDLRLLAEKCAWKQVCVSNCQRVTRLKPVIARE